MARAVATNFYTPKELTFQDGFGTGSAVLMAPRTTWEQLPSAVQSSEARPHSLESRLRSVAPRQLGSCPT